MDLIYLDYNCFQRGFDDPRQIKIQLEALACEEIFKLAEREKVTLIWSFMHEDENMLCPFIERKLAVSRLVALCKTRIGPEKEIYSLAIKFQQKTELSAKDAIHLAGAVYSKSDYFISCDKELIKRAQRLGLAITIMNPVDYIRKVEK